MAYIGYNSVAAGIANTSNYSMGELTVGKTIKLDNTGDVTLGHDGAVLKFGTDSDVTLTHVADNGLRLPDSRAMYFGNDTDLQIFHDGSNSYIQDQGTGTLIVKTNQFLLRNAAGSENMFDATQDGAVNIYYDNVAKLTTTSTGVNVTGDVVATDDLYLDSDSSVIHFGDDGDVTLTHTADVGLTLNKELAVGGGSNLNVSNHFTVDVANNSRYVRLTLDNNSTGGRQFSIHSVGDGDGNVPNSFAVYDDTASAWRQRIDSSGNVNFYADMRLAHDGAILAWGADYDVTLTHVADTGLRLSDGDKMLFGSDSDSEIYHNGSNFYISNDTGNALLYSDTFQFFSHTGSELFAQFNHNAAVNLYYDSAKKFETTSTGISVTGGIVGSDNVHLRHDGVRLLFGVNDDVYMEHIHDVGVRMPNNDKFQFGTDGALSLFHDGSNSYVHDSGTGMLVLATSALHVTNNNATESIIYAAEDGAVTLYHNNNAKLATTASGVSVTGNVVATGEATFGPGGTGTDVVNIIANGGSGAAGGSTFEVRSNGAYLGGLGNKAALLGSGTSTDIELRAASGIPIRFAPNNTDAVTLDTSGRGGIGAAPPATFGSTLYIQYTPAANKPIIAAYSTGNSNNARIGILNDTGNRGIWTEGGVMRFTQTYEGNSTAHMVISAGGNVGIATTSPASKFHVAGDITASGVSLTEASSIDLSTPLLASADHTCTGLTAQMLAGGAISAFDLVCVHTTTSEVVEADASAYATARVIGIAPAAISDTATGTILLQGFIRDDSWNWTPGSTLYLSETAGAMTHTAPSTDGAFVNVVGVALSPDVVYINPSMDVIERA